MKYRDLGSTGLKISEIVFGAGAVGGLVFRSERDTRLEAVRKALDYGINWIDTAPSYGDGQSEENLGWILKEVDANPYLSTKVRIGPEHAGDIPGEIERSMEISLKRLKRDSVDLIQLHTAVTSTRGAFRGSISLDDVLGDKGVLSGFERLREQGVASLFGFTALFLTSASTAVIIAVFYGLTTARVPDTDVVPLADAVHAGRKKGIVSTGPQPHREGEQPDEEIPEEALPVLFPKIGRNV